MKRLALVALVACSPKKQQPPPPAPAAAAPPVAKPIDLPDIGVADLRAVPAKSAIDLHWRAATSYDVGVVCRIEVYNLVRLSAFAEPSVTGTLDHDMEYRADPFVLAPNVCEVRFGKGHAVAGRVCDRDGALTAGPCPTGTFPPPKLPDGTIVDVQGASAHVAHDGRLALKALFTLGAAVDDASIALDCDANTNVDQGYVPLARLAAGETVFVSTTIGMKNPLAVDPKQCELRVTSKGKTLGIACIAEGETDAGPCPK